MDLAAAIDRNWLDDAMLEGQQFISQLSAPVRVELVNPQQEQWLILLLAAAFGAVIGGLIQAGITTWTIRQETKARERAQLLNALLRMSAIHTETYSIKNSIKECIDEAQQHNLGHLQLWEKIVPIVGYVPPVAFDASVISPLIMTSPKLVTDFSIAVMNHAALIDGILTYNRQRIDFFSSGAWTEVHGRLDYSAINAADMARLRPQIGMLEGLIQDIYKSTHELEQTAHEICIAFSQAAKSHLGSDFPQIRFKDLQ